MNISLTPTFVGLDDEVTEELKSFKFLGLMVDNSLTWSILRVTYAACIKIYSDFFGSKQPYLKYGVIT